MGNTSSPHISLPDMFVSRVTSSADKVAFRFPVPAPSGGSETWESLTWAQAHGRVRDITLGLHFLGVTSQARCAIISSTRIELVLVDLAILCAGGATTTIYPTSTPDRKSTRLNSSHVSISYAVFC